MKSSDSHSLTAMRVPANASMRSVGRMAERGSLNVGMTANSSAVGFSVAVAFIVATVLNHAMCQRCLNARGESYETQNLSIGQRIRLIEMLLRPLSPSALEPGL